MASHAQVAHAWAHQTGRAKTGHNVFYEGDTIYSYGRHYALARRVTAPDGTEVILVNGTNYSQSTNQQLGLVRGAISHLKSFTVRDPRTVDHPANYEDFLRKAQDYAAKSARAKKEWNRDHYISAAQEAVDDANAYAHIFGLPFGSVSLETIGVAIAGAEERIRQAQAAEAERRAKAEAERELRQRKERKAWQAGTSDYFYGRDAKGRAYMRVKGDELQTSEGASVPLDHAIRVFEAVKKCRETKTNWKRNGHRIPVGHFQVDEIHKDGSFKAGCHRFAWAEVKRVAASIGLA